MKIYEELNQYLDSTSPNDYIKCKHLFFDIIDKEEKEILRNAIIENENVLIKAYDLGMNMSGKIKVAEKISTFCIHLFRETNVDTGMSLMFTVLPHLPPLCAHFLLDQLSAKLYSLRNIKEEFLNYSLDLALLDVKSFEYYVDGITNQQNGAVYACPAWKRAVSILEKKKCYTAALEICEKAINLKISDSTTSGYAGNKEKLLKKVDQEKKKVYNPVLIVDYKTGEVINISSFVTSTLSCLSQQLRERGFFEELKYVVVSNKIDVMYDKYYLFSFTLGEYPSYDLIDSVGIVCGQALINENIAKILESMINKISKNKDNRYIVFEN